MKLTARNRNLLIFAVASLGLLAALNYFVLSDTTKGNPAGTPAGNPAAGAGSISMAQQRAARLRQIIATTPAREVIMKQTAADLADRERGVIQADTAPQAQAALLEIARRVAQAEQIDVRGGDLGAPRAFGDYGLVYATINFDCHIEQLVNFLADLGKQTELVVPSEERITSAGLPKLKLLTVRMVLAGIVAKKLVPEKKGPGVF